ncbi:cyclase family protein, partial [Streptomyces sp. P01-F02]|nr:cyclase family protein [Streptomyces poriferorum]
FLLVLAPLPFVGATGAPARPLALLPEDAAE